MRVGVEPEALAGWSDHARRTTALLRARLTALDAGLAPVVATWHGPAADAFTARRARWRSAADGLVGTLTDMATLVETAHVNYTTATAAGLRIWTAPRPSGGAAPAATFAGRGRGRIHADLDDIRAAVTGLVQEVDALARAWTTLGSGLSGSAAMAGDDDAASAFAADYDGMGAAAWRGWRSTLLLVDGIAGGLAASGVIVANAEAASTAGGPDPAPPLPTSSAPLPTPGPAPSAGGAGEGAGAFAALLDEVAGGFGDELAERLRGFWPTPDPARLRVAAAAWRTGAAELDGGVRRAVSAVDALTVDSPDAVLQEMRRFVGEALSADPSTGLTGVLGVTNGRIGHACEALADVTERTRAGVAAVLRHHAGGEEWYHAVAVLVDRIAGRPVGSALSAAGDAYLVTLDLATVHDGYVREVAALRGELHPAAAERLSRLATAQQPPRPGPAAPCLTVSPLGATGAPQTEAERAALVAEAVAIPSNEPVKPEEILQITRGWDGRPVWIARGNGLGGLQHLLRPERILAFSDDGVPPADIPGLALRAVAEGEPIGRPKWRDPAADEAGRRRGHEPAFVYRVGTDGGGTLDLVVVRSTNGFVVSAYPFHRKIRPL